jgi:hypothetical protein
MHWQGRDVSRLARGVGIAAIVAAGFVGTYQLLGGDEDAASTTFHDMQVIDPASFVGLVDKDVPAVRELARRYATPELAYEYVRDAIAYDPALPLAPPARTLSEGRASCLSKAVLLASLYRAIGMDDGDVRVVTGQAYWQEGLIEHAWLEIESGGRCLQQDPTALFGVFEFDEFLDTAYTRAHIRRELFCFNDRGFAVISLGDRFRGGPDPHQAAAGRK